MTYLKSINYKLFKYVIGLLDNFFKTLVGF